MPTPPNGVVAGGLLGHFAAAAVRMRPSSSPDDERMASLERKRQYLHDQQEKALRRIEKLQSGGQAQLAIRGGQDVQHGVAAPIAVQSEVGRLNAKSSRRRSRWQRRRRR